ncbi:hypothetical protein [Haloferax sulfurifontis]|uniref:Uncharacterized protein n=1 Tax=Haloferax sulfurifontis ATCC BAA-897 TaxID=662480 RepID=M0HZS2_9EURY|nr:hypothetical protein [Haloferax sulfurifontis]ELZ89258.1 hypothetical protein C441_17244 [Haloferax sulfurifontis ATCC BAA-897]
MNHFDRKIISIHDNEELNEAEVILKQTVNTTVRKLPLATFQEHEKQSDNGDEDGGDKLTNQSVGGVQRARQLAEDNPGDTLPAVYGGLFTVAEYFTRSFDAIKGKFFEKVIAAEEDSHRLDVDRNLGNLTQYLLEPELCWKSLDYTRETLTDDEEDRLSNLGSVTLNLGKNNKQANSDATLFFEDEGVLVFGEHRTSVVSGGTTARPSLMRKPKALVRELTKSNTVATVSDELEREYSVPAGSYTLIELLNEVGVGEIHFHIGILFNEKRTPARWEEDPQQGTSRRLIEQFEEELPTDLTKDLRDISLDADNLKLEFEVPVSPDSEESISFHLSFLYGDVYLNTIYSGSLDGVGQNGSLDAFDSPRSLRDIISDNEADDLWLGFSIAERENKVFEMSEEGRNNAMAIADMILESDTSTTRLAEFRSMLLSGERGKADQELLSFARDLAERYDESRDNRYVEGVYAGDPLDYLQDVAIEVLVYDAISRPIFLRRFPSIEEAEGEGQKELARVRETFEKYLFKIESDTQKKRRIYRCVRNLTEYSDSGENVPASGDDEVNWGSAPTSSDIGDLLDMRAPTKILNSMTDGTKDTDGGILVNRENKYAVPASVAQLMEPYMRELPDDVQVDVQQTSATDF